MVIEFDLDPNWKNICGATKASTGHYQSFDTQMFV